LRATRYGGVTQADKEVPIGASADRVPLRHLCAISE
jgi:hypothetical protein